MSAIQISNVVQAGHRFGIPKQTPIFEHAFDQHHRVASATEAENAIFDDHRKAMQQPLGVHWLYAYWDSDNSGEFASDHQPFMVQVLPLNREILFRRSGDSIFEPYWEVQILNGRGIVPMNARRGWIMAPTVQICPKSQILSNS
jgi:hypothetical protein